MEIYFKNVLDLEKVLENLFETQKVFYSETDFQFALGVKIHEEYPNYKVRCGYNDNKAHIDMLVITDKDQYIPIDLKYKTKKATIVYDNEKFKLKKQKDTDLWGYHYVRSIERIEEYSRTEEKFICGFIVMLTNDESCMVKSETDVSNEDFSIHQGDVKYGFLKWQKDVPKDAKEEVFLNGMYPIKWRYCPEIEGCKNTRFIYLFNQIERQC